MTRTRWMPAVVLLAAMAGPGACGGGGNSGPATSPPAAPTLGLGYGVKRVVFGWSTVPGATHYRLLENPDGASGYAQVGGDLTGTSYVHEIALHRRLNASYVLEACNAGGCTASPAVGLAAHLLPAIGYFKASNTEAFDELGASLALSLDGRTLAVGAPFEDGGPGGNPFENPEPESGAVYVFTWSGGDGWSQEAYLKASNAQAGDRFGSAVALSADGNLLAVGAPMEDSGAAGVGGAQLDETAPDSGAAYLFTRSAGTWTQQAYLKASNTGANDRFGSALALSGDGATVAVGATWEDSPTTGVGGSQGDDPATANSGAVYVFANAGGAWSQQAYLKPSNTRASEEFGTSLSVSLDGNTLAVGAPLEGSGGVGVGGNQIGNAAPASGAVYVFVRGGGAWAQQEYLKASNAEAADWFGCAVALSADASTLAVGACLEDSDAVGVGGAQGSNSAPDSGAVYVFGGNGAVWSQQAYLKASNTGPYDRFGSALALSRDGNTLAVGAYLEDGGADGVGGNQADDSAVDAGAVYVFDRGGGLWSQQAYLKASNSQGGARFGAAVGLSTAGETLAVGAPLEASGALGIGGNQADISASESGAVYLF